MIKKKKKDSVVSRFPSEFIEVIDINRVVEGFPTRSAYLKHLTKEIRPKAEDLKKKRLIKDEEMFF